MPGTVAWNIENDIGSDLASEEGIAILSAQARVCKRRATRDA
jgi:hypothetical protein